MIQSLIFVILSLKVLFRGYKFFIFVHTFQWTSSVFYSRFFSRKSQSQQRLAKKITHFPIQFRPKNSFYESHFTLKIICSPDTHKNVSHIKNFPTSMFLFDVRKNICTAPFLDALELHSWRTLKANVRIFLYISLRTFLFQRNSKILSGDMRGVLRRVAVWGSQNVLQFFILIEIFGNSTIFQHFNISIHSVKTLKFSRQFGLQR